MVELLFQLLELGYEKSPHNTTEHSCESDEEFDAPLESRQALCANPRHVI